jgi:hypothetical protein
MEEVCECGNPDINYEDGETKCVECKCGDV